MATSVRDRIRVTSRTAIILCLAPTPLLAQHPTPPPSVAGPDSVTIAAGKHYAASGLHRFLFGGSYRHLWTTPIRVPVLDLARFGGGLTPAKEGGGHQTKTLHFDTPDHLDYVFRSVDKDNAVVPEGWKGTILEKLALDGVSNSHPGAAIVADNVLEAVDILHAKPQLVVMPDDVRLGKFRKVYAGRLGTIELDPSPPNKGAPGFAGAREVIDSDSLLLLLNHDPLEHVDARAFLKARLINMLLNDWDRGPSQWKWARFGDQAHGAWEPIAKDHDKVLISSSGVARKLAGATTKMILEFGPQYGGIKNLTVNSIELDARLLNGLERGAWDSTTADLQATVSDSVLTTAVAALPSGYASFAPKTIATLVARRDHLDVIADRFYRYLADVVNVQGTDAADRATIARVDSQHVLVTLRADDAPPYYQRSFNRNETREVRVYLHGGSDSARVTGSAESGILVHVIGGNGDNLLRDLTPPNGKVSRAEFHDSGTVTNVSYGKDTLFNRRPKLHVYGQLRDPIRDHGTSVGPTFGLGINHDYGMLPRIGLARYSYGFGYYPYASRVVLDGAYSLKRSRYQIALNTDSRFANSPLHIATLVQRSQLELMNYYGLGNASTISGDTGSYAVHQSRWTVQPSLGVTLAPHTDLQFGPRLRYSSTDLTRGDNIATTRPYGVGDDGSFGEASLRLMLHHDNRRAGAHGRVGTTLDIGGDWSPAIWDVTTPFATFGATASAQMSLPLPTHPWLRIRGSAKKVVGGVFPFEDAAFLGGTNNLRTLEPQRFAGDAALYGGAELRVPVAHFTALLPFDLGVMGSADVGRVYSDGRSPGGWHHAYAAGIWFGVQELVVTVRMIRSNDPGPATVQLRFVMPSLTP